MPNEFPILVATFSALSILSVVAVLFIFKRRLSKVQSEICKQVHTELREFRQETSTASKELREEVRHNQYASTDSIINAITGIGKAQSVHLGLVSQRIKDLTASNESSIERLRNTIDSQLKLLQEKNEKKLEQIRETVDEKLHQTLKTRLGESFRLVSKQLEAVQRGLGEMQNLASDVGDLKRVLSNVKARGVWGEVQLGALLDDILTPEQYARNVRTRPNSTDFVEYAVRLPGTKDDPGSCVWLPIDSKFPQEDYLRLIEAYDTGDAEMAKRALSGLMRAINLSAREIKEKYIFPPSTTDFAIMFLPTEGLYAEVLRQAGQVEEIQKRYRIVISGPTTLCALLNSLRMGFQTLALEKRSGEVWTLLAAVKTEFGKFEEILQKVKRQLNAASSTIDQTATRTRAMERKLRQVETLSPDSSAHLLGITDEEIPHSRPPGTY